MLGYDKIFNNSIIRQLTKSKYKLNSYDYIININIYYLISLTNSVCLNQKKNFINFFIIIGQIYDNFNLFSKLKEYHFIYDIIYIFWKVLWNNIIEGSYFFNVHFTFSN